MLDESIITSIKTTKHKIISKVIIANMRYNIYFTQSLFSDLNSSKFCFTLDIPIPHETLALSCIIILDINNFIVRSPQRIGLPV